VLGTVPFQNMFKVVPYLEGSAVLINAPHKSAEYQPTQVVLLNSNFDQTGVIDLVSTYADNSYQLVANKSKDGVFYACITNNPNGSADNAYKGSILLYSIQENKTIYKYLDTFIPFKLEKYRITPTLSGGVAIAAWVRPTKDTRDLLFFELDENLELVKR
jgi:hypothetical protein